MSKVLLVDEEQGALRSAVAELEHAGFDAHGVVALKAALKLIETRAYVVVALEMALTDDVTAYEFLAKAAQASPGIGLLLVASAEEVRASKEEREPGSPPSGARLPSEAKIVGMRVLLRPFETTQLVDTMTHLARMAEMRKSTHAMASVVAPKEDDAQAPVRSPSERPPRSIYPRKS